MWLAHEEVRAAQLHLTLLAEAEQDMQVKVALHGNHLLSSVRYSSSSFLSSSISSSRLLPVNVMNTLSMLGSLP